MNDIRQLIPSTVRTPVKSTAKDRKSVRKARTFADYLPPQGRGYQTIPAPDVLSGLIKRAVEAMKKGVFWDRGSILNIKV